MRPRSSASIWTARRCRSRPKVSKAGRSRARPRSPDRSRAKPRGNRRPNKARPGSARRDSMAPPRSPLAPERFPDIAPITGVRLAVAAAGLRYRGRPDLLLVELAPETTVAGMLTRSRIPGHPVTWCRRILPRGAARGLVVNAGNANVLVGAAGDAAVRAEAETTAALLGATPEDVFVASTGVIGEPLPVGKITAALPGLY